MKIKRIQQLVTCSLAMLFSVLPQASGQQQHLQLSNPEGWSMPGLRAVSKGGIKPKVERTRIGNQDVTVSMYATDAAPIDDRLQRLPFLWPIRQQENAFLFQDVAVAASAVWVYETAGRRFAYIVQGSRYVYDPKSKAGGFAESIRLVFEDRNGDGRCELMHQGMASDYVPALPTWVLTRDPAKN